MRLRLSQRLAAIATSFASGSVVGDFAPREPLLSRVTFAAVCRRSKDLTHEFLQLMVALGRCAARKVFGVYDCADHALRAGDATTLVFTEIRQHRYAQDLLPRLWMDASCWFRQRANAGGNLHAKHHKNNKLELTRKLPPARTHNKPTREHAARRR